MLARAEAGRRLSASQMVRLDDMVARACGGPVLDESLALRLRNVMSVLGQTGEVTEIDDAFANGDPTTIEGRTLKAESLQNLDRPKAAEAIYRVLLAKLDQYYDDRSRWNVILAAARNASNLGDLPVAIQRYKSLNKYGMLTDAARLEYAGVLSKAGDTDEAERLLEQGAPMSQDLRLLASIYSSNKKFSKAIGVYHELLKLQPDDLPALRGVADNFFWEQDFAKAATTYREILNRTPESEAIRQLLAESLLYDKKYQDAVDEYATLLERFPARTDLWDGFLMAASGSPSLTEADRKILERIYHERGRHPSDEAFMADLANAIAKHGKPTEAVPLLQTLVARAPDDAALRLRLADTLHNLGRYKEADTQFRWLLDNPSSYATAKSP